jgi:ferredoxin--NADP+ reductase
MYEIVRKRILNDQVKQFEIYAPAVAKKALPGQFVIIRLDDDGERVPFTVSDSDAARGTITFVAQEVGKTTKALGLLNEGDSLANFVGPLGQPTHFSPDTKNAIVIGGGLGSAIAYPQSKALFSLGARVDTIVGFRNVDLVILEEEMKSVSTNLIVTTDDGSYGVKGFVTEALKTLLEDETVKYDVVFAIGPPIMMKVVCGMTKPYGIKTIVSLNPIMVDGTGMCGCCRVTVGGKTRFACIDGPDFDGHEVDFDELMKRNMMYREQEKVSLDRHICKLEEVARNA